MVYFFKSELHFHSYSVKCCCNQGYKTSDPQLQKFARSYGSDLSCAHNSNCACYSRNTPASGFIISAVAYILRSLIESDQKMSDPCNTRQNWTEQYEAALDRSLADHLSLLMDPAMVWSVIGGHISHLLGISESFLVLTHPWKEVLPLLRLCQSQFPSQNRPNSDSGLSFVIVAFAESSRTLIHMHHRDFGPIRSQLECASCYSQHKKYCTSMQKRRRGLGIDYVRALNSLRASARDDAESGGVGNVLSE